MLTRLQATNFKTFDSVDIELGQTVVFIGPNTCGKTSALQALALWHIGLSRWNEKRAGKETPEKRPGVTINRRDLTAIPVSQANLLWRDLHVRDVTKEGAKQRTSNVRIDVVIDGVTRDRPWACGLEFDYANPESLYCRPLRQGEGAAPARMEVPPEASEVKVAFLPPMSGLADREFQKQPGEIGVLLGEGRTAEVLRNLCYQLALDARQWNDLVQTMKKLFGVTLKRPEYVRERSEITMDYEEQSGVTLDLACAGRGLHQTLLLLAFMALNPGAVLLVDEPDAHLEVLRQREIYEVLTGTAESLGSQVVVASHSEVLLNEAAGRDIVIAFVGAPHRIDDRGSQVLKSLREIGFDQYYQAEQAGWVLYLEGSTDLSILKAFARKLSHPAAACLERPFVHYIRNQPTDARNHFHALREAKRNLVGFVLCDSGCAMQAGDAGLREYAWQRREIENYLCQPETLAAYAGSVLSEEEGPLLAPLAAEHAEVMRACIEDNVPPRALKDRDDPWWHRTKISDEFLDPLFHQFFGRLGVRNLMSKTNYHVLAGYVPEDRIAPEVAQVLDMIAETAKRAKQGT